MTRKEITGTRNLDFSQWIRLKLPDSASGFSVSDLDFILWNWKTKKIMLLEIKTRSAKPRYNQRNMWKLIHKWIKNGIDTDWKYLGFNLIVFEHTSFEDGKCFINNKEISEPELINILSLF